MSKYIGYVECASCGRFNHFKDSSLVTIWEHEDDRSLPITDCKCPKCGEVTTSRIQNDHVLNFRHNGVATKPYNDRFEPLTEEMIDEWAANGIDNELAELLQTQ